MTSHWPVSSLVFDGEVGGGGRGGFISVISFKVPESSWNRNPDREATQADQVGQWASLVAKKKLRPLSLLGEPQRHRRNSYQTR